MIDYKLRKPEIGGFDRSEEKVDQEEDWKKKKKKKYIKLIKTREAASITYIISIMNNI